MASKKASPKAVSRGEQEVVRLRIVVRDPIPDVQLRLQSGRDELVMPTAESATAVQFEFEARVAVSGAAAPIFYGPFTQGPPDKRFVYVNSGRRAGQAGTMWDRRAKIPLNGITPSLIRQALAAPGKVLEVSIQGRGRDGGPVCASVKLPVDAWKVVKGR